MFFGTLLLLVTWMVMGLLSKFLHSKNDLRAASGLADDQEVDALFYALKEAAGNINSNDHVSEQLLG